MHSSVSICCSVISTLGGCGHITATNKDLGRWCESLESMVIIQSPSFVAGHQVAWNVVQEKQYLVMSLAPIRVLDENIRNPNQPSYVHTCMEWECQEREKR